MKRKATSANGARRKENAAAATPDPNSETVHKPHYLSLRHDDGFGGLLETEFINSKMPKGPCYLSERTKHVFAGVPEADWPVPTAAELARVAAALPDGSDAERAKRAVALTWECALAQSTTLASLREWSEWRSRRRELLVDIRRKLRMKPDDFPLTHGDFLARLDTNPLQVQRKRQEHCDRDTQREPPLRGTALWLYFIRFELLPKIPFGCVPTEFSVERTDVSEREADEWNAQRERDGWPDAGLALTVAVFFDGWRHRVVRERKREAAQAGRKALKGARYQRRAKKSA